MASLYLRGKYIWLKYKTSGKVERKTLNPLRWNNKEDKKAAETILLEYKFFERKNSGGIPVDRYRELALKEAWGMFIAIKKLTVREKSLDAYKNAYTVFIQFINSDTKLKKITEETISQYKQFLSNRAYNTIVNYLNHLRIFFEYLKKENYISHNPVKPLREKEVPITIIPKKDIDKILSCLKEKNIVHYRFVYLLYLTGLRTGEAVDLRWEDIDFNQNILNVRNTKANRIDPLPLYSELLKFLKGFKSKGRMFAYRNNRSLKFWNRALEGLKMNYSLHDIRRTFGTSLAKKLTPYELQKIMRHSSIKTTLRYYIHIDINEIGKKI